VSVMGRLLIIGLLAVRDIRHRLGQAVLLLLAITAATAVLSLGLVMHGVTNQPYQQTRTATRGPDLVANLGFFGMSHISGSGSASSNAAQLAGQVSTLEHMRGVTGSTGPYLLAEAVITTANGHRAGVAAEGRDEAPAAIDQPLVVSGTWIRPGGVVLERTFAEALGVSVGARVMLAGHPYTVVGIAVTAAEPPYPNLCYATGGLSACGAVDVTSRDFGMAWVTGADAQSLVKASGMPPLYLLNLKLSDPGSAQALANAYDQSHQGEFLSSWQDIASADGLLIADQQTVLDVGAWLASLLAIASVAVLAGGRMAEQNRRTGLLKAVGATPETVAAVLLAENVGLALLAAGTGLAIGWLAAPLVTSPGAALLGNAGAPSVTVPIVVEVLAVALIVALAATLIPAIRASRTSTVSALADAARTPRRHGTMVAMSARLPVPLLLGLRLATRRLRRAALSMASIAVTVSGLVAVLAFHTLADGFVRASDGSAGLTDPVISRDEQMLTVLTIVLLALSALNAVTATWATVIDTRHTSALARALGATPRQVSLGQMTAQVIPVVPGAIAGVPLGIALFSAANSGGTASWPPAGWLVAAVIGALAAVAAIAYLPAWLATRQSAASILQAEVA
jgi:ABC-type antimicrobial peptide transport system permease subunit